MRVTTFFAAVATTVSYFIDSTTAQTYSNCNPLLQSGCPADSALGKSETFDFTSGASSRFTSSGSPTYNGNGAAFTVAKSGDSPLLSSSFYIMFGHVEYSIQAAPGQGIVSSAVLQSDCLDEIDWEWLGGDDTQVQSNYFGKGITTTYNRGAFHADPNNHDGFHTYSIDWTAEQIVWQIDGVTVRVLTVADAAAGQYPQTPMYIKVGAWSGGDPSNPPGTIQWAGGETDYSAGPFTMYCKSIKVSDYSTGTSYSYSGTSGTWQSIKSNGGSISSTGQDTPANTVASPSVTSASSNNAPVGDGKHSHNDRFTSGD
jgi:beta-glucanase (GH16 family)